MTCQDVRRTGHSGFMTTARPWAPAPGRRSSPLRPVGALRPRSPGAWVLPVTRRQPAGQADPPATGWRPCSRPRTCAGPPAASARPAPAAPPPPGV